MRSAESQRKEAEAKMRREALPMRRFSVLGTPLCATSYTRFIEVCQNLAQTDQVYSIDFSNTQIVTLRRHCSAFRKMTSEVDFFIPDGMPLIWCLNAMGAGLKDRVYGPAFMRQFLLQSPPKLKHFFLGGSESCLSALRQQLTRQNPQLQIVGTRNGYFSAAEEEAIIEEINRSKPDFVWVGLGTPKQQDWICRFRSKLQKGLILAVGFAFDVNAGTKPDAPFWMQRWGLTWFFRLASEPLRLGPRYVFYNSLFLFYLLWDGLRGRAFSRPD